jgi:1-acyl-sn-glycerol-3-phosphate acyltransferase
MERKGGIDALRQSFVAFLARMACGTQVRGEENFDFTRQAIFFANHSSNLDFLAIWSALPEHARYRTRPIAAADYWCKGRMRPFLADKIFRAVLIERHGGDPKGAQAKMQAALSEGSSIIIFPEGTRSLDGELNDFKSGLFYMAKANREVPCVPVFLENLNRILPKGQVLPVPLLGTLTFGEALHVGAEEGKLDFLTRAKAALQSLQRQMSGDR